MTIVAAASAREALTADPEGILTAVATANCPPAPAVFSRFDVLNGSLLRDDTGAFRPTTA